MILVTGATGNVGGELVRILHSEGHKVRVVVRDRARAAHLPDAVEVALGDLTQPETLAPALAGVERLFLMESARGVEQTTNMVAAAREESVQLIVNFSSMGASFDPMPVIGRWHADREDIIRESGIDGVFLRPSALMSNTLWWRPSIEANGTVVDPIGPGRLSSIDPADVAAAAAVTLTQDGHTGNAYVLTGRELLTVEQQVATLSRVLERPIRYVEQTPEEAAAMLRERGAPDSYVAASKELNEVFRADRIAFLTDEVDRLTGRPPGTFEDWCRRNAALFD